MTSASATEKNQLTVHVNAALSVLGNGWMTHHDALRVEVDRTSPSRPGPIRCRADRRRAPRVFQWAGLALRDRAGAQRLVPATGHAKQSPGPVGLWRIGRPQDDRRPRSSNASRRSSANSKAACHPITAWRASWV